MSSTSPEIAACGNIYRRRLTSSPRDRPAQLPSGPSAARRHDYQPPSSWGRPLPILQ